MKSRKKVGHISKWKAPTSAVSHKALAKESYF